MFSFLESWMSISFHLGSGDPVSFCSKEILCVPRSLVAYVHIHDPPGLNSNPHSLEGLLNIECCFSLL